MSLLPLSNISSLLVGLPRHHSISISLADNGICSRGVAATRRHRGLVSSTIAAAAAMRCASSTSSLHRPLPRRRYGNIDSFGNGAGGSLFDYESRHPNDGASYYYSPRRQNQQWHYLSSQSRRLSTTPSSSSSSSPPSTPQRTKGSSGGGGGSNNAIKANGGKRKGGGTNKNKRGTRGRDPSILINEHLIAELFNRHRHQQQQQQQQGSSGGDGNKSSTTVLTAETYEVRLIIDRGREKSSSSSSSSGIDRSDEDEDDGESTTDDDSDSDDDISDDDNDDKYDDDDDDDDEDDDDDKAEGENGNSKSESSSTTSETPTPISSSSSASTSSTAATTSSSSTTTTMTQLTTLDKAITIAHEYSLDLVGITLSCTPPVIKAVNYDRHVYELKKRLAKITSTKKKDGRGAISDRSLKEYKFRAGIAHHDLLRKTSNMMKYLEKGHAIRVTLTARQRSIKEDADAISTTLDRVRELVGDRAVEVKKLTANERNSYGSLLLHPAK